MPTSGDLPYPPADGRGQGQWGKQAVWHEALVPGKTAESCLSLLMSFLPRGPGACFSNVPKCSVLRAWTAHSVMFGVWGSAEGSAFGLQLSTMSTGETPELIDVVRKGREAKPCVGGTLTQYSLS